MQATNPYQWPTQYQQPMYPSQYNQQQQAQIESLQSKLKEMEARYAGGYSNQNVYGQAGSGFGSGYSGQSNNPAAPPPVLLVNTEDEINLHIDNIEFKMSGKRLTFYVTSSDEYLTVWHSAELLKTVKKRYREVPEDEGISEATQQNENPIWGRFDRLEQELVDLKGLIIDAQSRDAEFDLDPHAEERETTARSGSSGKPNNGSGRSVRKPRDAGGRFVSDREG